MSIAFSDTTNKSGLIQQIERNCGFNDGDISGNTLRMAQFTSDINQTMDDALAIIFKAGGTWQYDDSSHADFPVVTANLTSGTRRYSFTEDDNSNLLLGIYKVMVMDEAGVYQEVKPVDLQSTNSNENVDSFVDGQDETGVITSYDKTGKYITFNLTPTYSQTGGIQVYINRESTYFTVSDTTKKPGIDGLCQEYLSLVPSYKYARNHSLPNVARLEKDVSMMEQKIKDRYGRRERDTRRAFVPVEANNR